MNIERLNRLKEILEQVPFEKLNMWGWVNDCGTAACALGWAAMDPEFQKLGLKLEPSTMGSYPVFEDTSSFGAGARFFDISSNQSEFLFCPYKYHEGMIIKSSMVIARINELINNPDHPGHAT